MRKTILVAIVSLCLAAAAFAQCEILTFLTESLPTFDINEPAHFQIEVIGGTAPYHFEIYDGALPAGLHLTGTGKIVGKPTQFADTTVFITVTDHSGCQLTQAYAVRVEDI